MISIIIPVYNEEKAIKGLLDSFSYNDGHEVIVVDGGSKDRTLEFTKQYPVNIVESIKNRAVQMNEGAKKAMGGILFFLHADCLLERDALKEISNSLNNGFLGGCLSQKINSKKLIYRFIEASGNIRAKIFKIFYGDQGIFIRKSLFFQIGGFDQVELFDDIIFSKKLKKTGKTRVLNSKIYTSSRRWERQGVIITTLVNWIISIGFIFGVSPEKLKKIYYDIR